MTLHTWESIEGDPGHTCITERLRVPGGWLYRTRYYKEGLKEYACSIHMVFVPEAS